VRERRGTDYFTARHPWTESSEGKGHTRGLQRRGKVTELGMKKKRSGPKFKKNLVQKILGTGEQGP